MTTTAAPTAALADAGQWKLTGVHATAGQCDCCARRITQRVFQVAHPDHGSMSLGRRCAAKATGYASGAVEREAARVAYMAEMDRRYGVVLATYPSLAQHRHTDTREGNIISTAVTTHCWWGGSGWAAYPTWVEYIDDCMARA